MADFVLHCSTAATWWEMGLDRSFSDGGRVKTLLERRTLTALVPEGFKSQVLGIAAHDFAQLPFSVNTEILAYLHRDITDAIDILAAGLATREVRWPEISLMAFMKASQAAISIELAAYLAIATATVSLW